MAGEWRETALGDLIDFVSGGTPSKDNASYWNGAIPWVSAKDMKRLFLDDAEDHITESGLSNGARLAPAKTVLLLTRGMTLLSDIPICVARRPMAFNQDVKALRPKGRVIDDFIPYLLLGNKRRLLNLVDLAGHGTGRLNTDELRSLDVRLPPEDEQRAIAHILGTLDEKIELNRRMDETLEAMARALFKSWFVDFGPVRAKAEGRDPGLPKPLADLFPDSFEDSELGEIPKGWSVKPLSETTTLITKGTTPTQSDTAIAHETDREVNYVRVNAIDADGTILFEKLTTISPAVHRSVLKRSILQIGDVLYTIAGTIGRTAVVDESLLPANTNQAVAIIRPRSGIPPPFLLMAIRVATFREELHSNIVHAVQANLSLGVLSRARIVVPRKETLPQIFAPIDELTRRMTTARAESHALVALRDAQLPRLVSGELRVNDPERFLEMAV